MKLKQTLPLHILVVAAIFTLAMAILDYYVAHSYEGPTVTYKYWTTLTLVFLTFGFAITYVYWLGTTKKISNPYIIPGIFFTVVLLYTSQLLDIFFFLLTRKAGEPYSFEVWSPQYKWGLKNWNWGCQIIWSSFFIFLIFLMWWMILKKSKTGMVKHA